VDDFRVPTSGQGLAVRLELTAQAGPRPSDSVKCYLLRHGAPHRLGAPALDQPAAIPSITAPSPGTLPIGVRDPSELIRNSKTVPPPAPASA
jgi:hypothetical protein